LQLDACVVAVLTFVQLEERFVMRGISVNPDRAGELARETVEAGGRNADATALESSTVAVIAPAPDAIGLSPRVRHTDDPVAVRSGGFAINACSCSATRAGPLQAKDANPRERIVLAGDTDPIVRMGQAAHAPGLRESGHRLARDGRAVRAFGHTAQAHAEGERSPPIHAESKGRARIPLHADATEPSPTCVAPHGDA